MLLVIAALVTTAASALVERWWLAQAGYGLVFIILLKFAVRRFVGRAAGRRPPAAFVLVPFAIAHALFGAACIACASLEIAPPRAMAFGKLLIGQGVFLCLVVGIGSLVLPLVSGAAPPPDLGSSPRETRKALAYVAVGVGLFASFVLENVGWVRGGPLARALILTAALVAGTGAWRPPGKPGLHRRLIWVALWLVPVGLLVSGLWPAYRVPALHIVFIGGFGLMAFAVATHVNIGHLGLEHLSTGRPFAVAALAVGFPLALLVRLAADASDRYFDYLAWAAAVWLLASGIWLVSFGPHMVRRIRS
jgi:hypothetical protein